jgi:hypothetical protein
MSAEFYPHRSNGLALICAGTRHICPGTPHLRRPAISAPGLAHICARTKPVSMQSASTSAPRRTHIRAVFVFSDSIRGVLQSGTTITLAAHEAGADSP